MRRNKRYVAPSSKKHPVLWMLTGLLIGIFVCSLFFLKKKVAVVTENPPEQTQPAPAHQLKHKLNTADNKKNHTETTDQYDFYTMLPKMQSNQAEAPAAATPPPRPTKPLALAEQSMLSPETKPEAEATSTPSPSNTRTAQTATNSTVQKNPTASSPNPEPVPPPANKKYIVVTGDFDHYEAADAQKAELVLAGITHAKVESYMKNNTAHYRINLGSYSNKANATKVLGQLQAAQLSGTIIEPS